MNILRNIILKYLQFVKQTLSQILPAAQLITKETDYKIKEIKQKTKASGYVATTDRVFSLTKWF